MGRVTTQIKLKWTGLFTIIALCAILLVPLTSNIFALIGLFVLLGLISGFGFCGGFSMVVDFSEKNRGFYTGRRKYGGDFVFRMHFGPVLHLWTKCRL